MTEVYLNTDQTVTIGNTDGPQCTHGSGVWTQNDDLTTFAMTISRRYGGGREALMTTDMGEFEFEVERNYVGEMIMIGDHVGISGSMKIDSDISNTVFSGGVAKEVGFFSMIDTGPERTVQEKRSNEAMDASGGTDNSSFSYF